MLGNSFGRVFRVYACGESYGEALQIIVDGVPAGIRLTNEDIQKELDRRRPGQSAIDSPRGEKDKVEIVAGLLEGVTTGAPVGMIIRNVDRQKIHVDQYRAVKDVMRPGHGEHTFWYKYGPYADWCGAGRGSGRETACRVAAGALAKKILREEGIEIAGYVRELHGIKARDVTFDEILENGEKNDIRCPDLETAEKMIKRCREIKAEGDTCGGVVEIRVWGVPPGLGEPVFDKLSAALAHAIMSIGAVKGFEIGAGFETAKMKGSECNDIPYVDNGRIRFRTNRSGGINGGISNGEEIVIRMAVKPTSTISIEQESVNMPKLEPATLAAITRRDATICARIVAVGEAMVAITIADHLMLWRAYDSMQKFEHPWRKLTAPQPAWGK